MVIIIADLNNQASTKLDASIGLLTNVPEVILNRLNKKFNIGKTDNRLELIILYRDKPETLQSFIQSLDGKFQDLGFNFAIVDIPIDKLQELATSNSIQYIELPKNLYGADSDSNRASCVDQAASVYNLSGKGILIGFVDSGIDYTHPAFMNEDGTTRIEVIYDLSDGGKIYNKQVINEAIKSSNAYEIVPSTDVTGHGTHVVGDACAGGVIPYIYKGAAPQASIAMVKAARGSWILSSQIMQGIKFLLDKSKELNMPLVINLSLSTNNGAHNGTSLLEQYIRTIANLERVTIVIAAGNEGDAGHHTGDSFKQVQSITFNVASDETLVVLNLYKTILPDSLIKVIGPTGQQSAIINIREGYFQGNIGRDRYDIYASGPKPFELNSEIQIIISSISSDYLAEGVWELQISTVNDYEGSYSIWLPISEGLNPKTKFLQPTVFNTLGIPATVENIIAVGSYNAITNTISSFSGRGPQVSGIPIRPDIVAPGEGIKGPAPNGGYDTKTGTSMAAPQVAGICALMMEWGIVKGNDPYLFGQRLKYYLVKGANRSRMDIKYPNPSWGYGKVCAYESLFLVEDTINAILSGRGLIDNKRMENDNNVSEVDVNTVVTNKYKLNEYMRNINWGKFEELKLNEKGNEFQIGSLLLRIPKSD